MAYIRSLSILGGEVTSPIYIVPLSRAWHQANHSLAFCGFVWLSDAELITLYPTFPLLILILK